MPGNTKVETTYGVDDSAVIQSLKRQAAGMEGLTESFKEFVEVFKEGYKQHETDSKKAADDTEHLSLKHRILRNDIKEIVDEHKKQKAEADELVGSYTNLVGVIGTATVAALTEAKNALAEYNAEVVKTQQEYDKVAAKARVALMMARPDYEKYREEHIEPLRKKVGLSEDQAAMAFTNASNVPEKDRDAVVAAGLTAGRGAGITGGDQLLEYQKSLMAQLPQQHKDLTAANITAAGVPVGNIAGQLKLTGEEALGTQRQVGMVEGVNNEQLWAEYGALVKKGGLDKGAAGQRLMMITRGLRDLPDKAQEQLGGEASSAIREHMEKGDIMSALDVIKSAEKNMNKSQRSSLEDSIAGKRGGSVLGRLLSNQDYARDLLTKSGDVKTFNERAKIAGDTDEAADTDIEAQGKDVKIREDERKKKNARLLKLLDIELESEKIGPTRRSMILGGTNMGASHIPFVGDKLPTVGGFKNTSDWEEYWGMAPDLEQGFQARADQNQGYGGNATFAKVMERYKREQAAAVQQQQPVQAPPTVAGQFAGVGEIPKYRQQLAEAQAKQKHDQAEWAQKHRGVMSGYEHTKEARADDMDVKTLVAKLDELVTALNTQKGRSH
jgi:hypothetical protein